VAKRVHRVFPEPVLSSTNYKMVRKCAVSTCKNYQKPKDTIHSFPTNNPHQLKRWVQFVKLVSKLNVEQVNLEHYGVCACHFSHESYLITKTETQRNQNSRGDRLKEYAVPIFKGESEINENYFMVYAGILLTGIINVNHDTICTIMSTRLKCKNINVERSAK